MIIVGPWAGVFKKQRTTSDGFTLDIIKYSLTSTTSAKIIAGMSSKITIICHSCCSQEERFCELLYSEGGWGVGLVLVSHSGAGLIGGRFRCLKYWVTC